MFLLRLAKAVATRQWVVPSFCKAVPVCFFVGLRLVYDLNLVDFWTQGDTDAGRGAFVELKGSSNFQGDRTKGAAIDRCFNDN